MYYNIFRSGKKILKAMYIVLVGFHLKFCLWFGSHMIEMNSESKKFKMGS